LADLPVAEQLEQPSDRRLIEEVDQALHLVVGGLGLAVRGPGVGRGRDSVAREEAGNQEEDA
jgi:hypothetical protein